MSNASADDLIHTLDYYQKQFPSEIVSTLFAELETGEIDIEGLQAKLNELFNNPSIRIKFYSEQDGKGLKLLLSLLAEGRFLINLATINSERLERNPSTIKLGNASYSLYSYEGPTFINDVETRNTPQPLSIEGLAYNMRRILFTSADFEITF